MKDSSAAAPSVSSQPVRQQLHENTLDEKGYGRGDFDIPLPTIEDLMTTASSPLLSHDDDGSPSSSSTAVRHALQSPNEVMNDPSSSSGSAEHHDIDFYHRAIMSNNNIRNRKLGLRAGSTHTRMAQDVNFATPSVNANVNNGDSFNSTTIDATTTMGSDVNGDADTQRSYAADDVADSYLFTLLSFLILSPCVCAFIAQTVYCIKKRKRDRVERKVLEVSTNPQSRMLVLSEIFKNDSRPVTENDASPKKKRVLVKKYRKKTRSERKKTKKMDNNEINIGDFDDDGEDEEMGGRQHSIAAANSHDWSSVEEEDTLSTADGTRMVVCFSSSYDHLEGTARADSSLVPRDEGVVDAGDKNPRNGAVNIVGMSLTLGGGSDDENQPMAVYASDNLDSNDELPLSQDEASKVDKEVTGRSSFVYKKGPVNIDWAPKSNSVDLDVEREQKVDDSGTSDETDPKEVSSSVEVANDTVVRKEESEDVPLDNEENAKTGSLGDKYKKPIITTENNTPKHGNAGRIPEITTDDNAAVDDMPQNVSQKPKITNMPSLDSPEEEVTSSNISETGISMMSPNNPLDVPPAIIIASPHVGQVSPRALLDKADATETLSTPPRVLIVPDQRNENDITNSNDEVDKDPIFKGSTELDEDEDSIPEIPTCGSSETEAASNVDGVLNEGATGDMSSSVEGFKMEPLRRSSLNDTAGASSLFDPYPMDRTFSGSSSVLGSHELGVPIPMNGRVESYKSTGSNTGTSVSNVSYFSYDEVSIASEESELCAICLCPYEEGDIRIFSKRCPHVFHKECILEWLVKCHNECPCCRKEMVTKSELKETSVSLLGTEQLARALVVVEGSEMQQAPPFRRGIQRTRQMFARAREQARVQRDRRGSQGDASPLTPQQSSNAHWLWNARFGQPNSPTTSVITPGALPPGLSSMPRLNEVGLHSTTNPLTPRVTNRGPDNIHNRDWLWATRFGNNTPSDLQVINPSRSSDAIMNPHESNAAATTQSSQLAAAPPEGVHVTRGAMHDTVAGSLFSSTLHNHWQHRQLSPQRTTTRPTLHSHWQQQQQHRQLSPQRTTTRPTLHSHWQQQQANPQTTINRSTLHHSHWQQQQHQSSQTPIPRSTLHHSHWQQRQNSQMTPRRNNCPPSLRVHAHWRRSPASGSNSEEEELPVTVLPAI